MDPLFTFLFTFFLFTKTFKLKEITEIVIVNASGKVVYEKAVKNYVSKETTERVGNDLKKQLEAELRRTGVDMQTVLKRYHIENESDMTADIYERAILALKKTADKKVV